MEVYPVKTASILPLGKQGENLVRQIHFDLSRWISNFGPGTVQLLHQRSGDETPYPVAVEQAGNLAVWTVTSADTSSAGTGRAELQYYVGDALAKSETWMTKVLPALGPASETPPEAQQGWVDQVLAQVARITGMTAQAVELPAGSAPTADYADGVLTIGIPLGGDVSEAQIAQAVAEYLSKNPITETDPTVPDWAKEETKPSYTAAEVGAVSSETLPDAINTALAQAKESGEFDGAAGQDGAPGQDGITPTIGANGNWYLGDTDTGKPSRGETGQAGADGRDGADGQPGADGKSAYAYAVEGGYTGTEEAFAAKMAGGGLTAAQIDLLEDAFEHIQWADDAGPQYAAQLITSLRGGESGGEQPEQPDTPKTLTGISAEYSGGNVAVGTELSSLSGITVTAHYSDGTTASVTGYTLSGTIAEGDNTITVTYMGKTATITVTGEAQSADDRTLLHNWILNDQNGSNIDTVSGATLGGSGITKSSDGWTVPNVYNYIFAKNVNGYNRSIECDIASSTVAEDLETGIFIGFGTETKSPSHYISYRNKTWGWESTDTYKTEKVITELVGVNPFSSKTLVLCVNAEGYIDLYLDGAYLSTSPWAVTAPNLVMSRISVGYAPFTVSGIRIYEGVL